MSWQEAALWGIAYFFSPAAVLLVLWAYVILRRWVRTYGRPDKV